MWGCVYRTENTTNSHVNQVCRSFCRTQGGHILFVRTSVTKVLDFIVLHTWMTTEKYTVVSCQHCVSTVEGHGTDLEICHSEKLLDQILGRWACSAGLSLHKVDPIKQLKWDSLSLRNTLERCYTINMKSQFWHILVTDGPWYVTICEGKWSISEFMDTSLLNPFRRVICTYTHG
jgi:hypothetical protein